LTAPLAIPAIEYIGKEPVVLVFTEGRACGVRPVRGAAGAAGVPALIRCKRALASFYGHAGVGGAAAEGVGLVGEAGSVVCGDRAIGRVAEGVCRSGEEQKGER
jgi:hypothetical protein